MARVQGSFQCNRREVPVPWNNMSWVWSASSYVLPIAPQIAGSRSQRQYSLSKMRKCKTIAPQLHGLFSRSSGSIFISVSATLKWARAMPWDDGSLASLSLGWDGGFTPALPAGVDPPLLWTACVWKAHSFVNVAEGVRRVIGH